MRSTRRTPGFGGLSRFNFDETRESARTCKTWDSPQLPEPGAGIYNPTNRESYDVSCKSTLIASTGASPATAQAEAVDPFASQLLETMSVSLTSAGTFTYDVSSVHDEVLDDGLP